MRDGGGLEKNREETETDAERESEKKEFLLSYKISSSVFYLETRGRQNFKFPYLAADCYSQCESVRGVAVST